MTKSFRFWLALMLTSFLIVACYSAATAQNFTMVEAEKVAPKVENVSVESISVDLMVAPSGAYYVNKVSKNTGKPYKQYLGYKTDHLFSDGNTRENEVVYSNKDQTEYWVLGFTKNGTLKKYPLQSN